MIFLFGYGESIFTELDGIYYAVICQIEAIVGILRLFIRRQPIFLN